MATSSTAAEDSTSSSIRRRITTIASKAAETLAAISKTMDEGGVRKGGGKTRGERAIVEGDMQEYEGTFDDYLELFLQFGFVFLFSSVYPLAAFWALLNNLLEMKSDGFKLCRVYRRPFSQSTSNIGAWQTAFEVLGVIGVMTNTGLLYMNIHNHRSIGRISPSSEILLFVAFEHLIIGAKCVLAFAIPDVPEWVRKALARTEWKSKQALRKERQVAT